MIDEIFVVTDIDNTGAKMFKRWHNALKFAQDHSSENCPLILTQCTVQPIFEHTFKGQQEPDSWRSL